jgi:hypothetical protein
MRKSVLPFRPEIKEVQGHRKPTQQEIKFGQGATHYKIFPVALWKDKKGMPKCWIICPEDGLRYYR